MLFEKFANLSISLLGFDIFCLNKKFLVLNMVERNLKIKYRRTFLGFFWTILTPVMMSTIYYFVFKVILNVQKEHYLAFMICGVMPWSFFVQSVGESTEAIVGNAGLLTKIPIPIHVFPYVTSITNFSTLALSIPVIFASALISNTPITLYSLWIFYFFTILMLITYALGATLSILFVYLRDLRHAIGLILQLWFYATPVLYDSSMIPLKYRWILYANPVGCIFEGIHASFISGRAPDASILLGSAAWVVFFFIALRFVHSFLRPGLVERI
jgi:ABC-type polysaccharide/polyol phosphate export permease